MLLPQYTIRRLLGVTAVCAVVFSILSMGLRGNRVLAAISVAIGAVVIVALIHVAMFLLVAICSAITGRRQTKPGAYRPKLPNVLPALLLATAWAATAQAGGISNRSNGNGLNVDVRTWTNESGGYRPLIVKITPTAPVKADRTLLLDLRFTANPSAKPEEYDLRIRRPIEIPAGSGTMQVTISLPRPAPSQYYMLDVIEDDKVLPNLSFPWRSFANTSYGWDHAFPVILAMDDTRINTAELASLFPVQQYFQDSGSTKLPTGVSLPSLVTLAPADFSRQWIDYTTLDVVYLTLEQLQSLRRKQPEAWRAMLAWVSAGGNLWVSELGSQWDRLKELEGLVEFAPQTGWTTPDAKQFGEPFRCPYQIDRNRSDAKVAKWEKSEVPRTATPPKLRTRLKALGQVAAFAENPFPGTRYGWGWVLNTVGSERWYWPERHGLSIQGANPDFWKFLIPGVGLAPVRAFYVLITLFAVTIGPVNYWLLRRWKRLHLLVVTIPAGAAVVAAALVGYALLADGLGARVRARSVTWIDRQGQAVCWSRLSYYAGLTPASGLTFPDDVAVLPMQWSTSTYRWRHVPEGRLLDWEGPQQRLTLGWLRARYPTQFITISARPARAQVVLISSGSDRAPPVVQNQLGTPIRQLTIRTPNGRYYRGAELAAGQTAALEPVAGDGTRSVLGPSYHDSRPELPPGVESPPQTSAWFPFPHGPGMELCNQETSRLERTLALCDGDTADLLRPGSYAAIVNRSPEVDLGLERVEEVAGFHVVVGEW